MDNNYSQWQDDGPLDGNVNGVEPYMLDGGSLSSDASYSRHLADVLGSDEEPDNKNSRPGESSYDGTAEDEATDEVGELTNGRYHAGEISIATEAGSSVSSLSLRPLRPWQFPAPKRLRSLQSDTSHFSIDSPSVILSGSPSILSEDGSSRHNWMLPYGEPTIIGNDLNGASSFNGLEKSSDPSILTRSFLRMSRLCTLHDQEGSPTVMAVAGGILAVGTETGKVGLFNRSKGWTGVVSVEGIVTALAISSDKTFLGVGTSLGHIYLYDFNKLSSPARHVAPVVPNSVAQGRSEGHLQGSKVLHLAFVGIRHTAIVSADEYGLSFYHSLGKILGVSSNDTLRILGKYPDLFKDVRNRKLAILGMSALPLGSTQHASDSNNFVALLTPSKMVLVGLKPAARTWYRQMSPEKGTQSIAGCLAWMPSSKSFQASSGMDINPTLAFSFERHLRFIRLVTSGSGSTIQVSILEEKSLNWTHSKVIEAIQWISPDFLVLYSDSRMSLFDTRLGKCTEEQATIIPVSNAWLDGDETVEERKMLPTSVGSLKSHKGTLFVLTSSEVLACSLITWADRVLALVSTGNFLGAIELVTSLLQDKGTGGGSRVGLPEAFTDQRPILASRLIELMKASSNYAFSEDRMKDDMANQRGGVDRTPLFEGLARVCAQASLALEDFTFLFDELFDMYSEAGIEAIFADQMETFIVDGQVKVLPIPVVQRLISVRERQGRFDLAERIIWNVDPVCLDLNQAIRLCLQHGLHDALIYIYTKALHDFVGPIVELLPLIKKQDSDAYRIISYLSITLIGLSYPTQEKLEEKEAILARSSLYSFLLSGRCVIWPPGAGGKLILTRDEDGDFTEPTFPYLCLFLHFDAEAFLDALDVAFDDAWLDEGEMTRQDIILILFDMINSQQTGQIFLAIFIARNAPKFAQFIRLAPAQVETLLATLSVALDDEEGDGTLEDRQFAVECLLSAYRPKQTSNMLDRFEQAGFVEILRRVYRSEGKWDKLAHIIITGPHNEATLDGVREVLRKAGKDERVQAIILQAIPALVDVDVKETVAVIQRYMKYKQTEAIRQLDRSPHRQFAYLSALLDLLKDRPNDVDNNTRNSYFTLICSIKPQSVVKSLDERGPKFFDLHHVVDVAREEGVMDGLLWARDRLNETREGLQEMEQYISERQLILRKLNMDSSVDSGEGEEEEEVVDAKEQILVAVNMAVRICTERAQEELWIEVLQTVIHLNHDLGDCPALEFSRTLLEDTLSSFVSSTSAERASFSSLFQRLVPDNQGSTYAEVRIISDGMMAANKLRQELLSITNRLFDRDVHRELINLTQKQRVGWRPASRGALCSGCGQRCIGEVGAYSERKTKRRIVSANQARSPFLEPIVSPRPDKGKGIARGNENGASNSHDDDVDDFFGVVASALVPSSDPIDVFSTTPAELVTQDTSLQPRIPLNYGDVESDKETDSEDADAIGQDEGVIVFNNGAIWHRRCASI